ncbi:MAG: hypothetical protein BMS9Abin09_0278 [Gammaproteobacteria bacterium]|nr:MAG: hypothetical protein BMS9Abin09_0278 [Gammaproteobacteria bacterium]
MGIRERKPAAVPAKPRQQPRPVDIAIAAEVRRRAEKLAAAGTPGKNGTQARNHQRQQTEQQMAKLRGEAVQARRLAEHIENLSQEAAASRHKRKQAMTDTTIVNPGSAKRRQRRTGDKPGPSGNRLNFNPLHPSMELPPEQLIRLLGMESKKIRKSRKTRKTPKQAPVVALETADTEQDRKPPPAKPHPLAVSPVNRSIQYERSEPPQVFDNGRSGLLVPSLLVGLVAGIVVSGYLFWSQPADTRVQKAPAPDIAKQVQPKQSQRQLVKRTMAPAAKEQKMSAQENVEWRATVKAQQQRLRTAAEQRLSERVSQMQQTPQPAVLQTAPVRDALPVTAPEPASAPEPINEAVLPMDTLVETPLPEPVPAAVELQDVQEESPAIEAIQPDADVLSEMPGESASVMPEAVEIKPQTSDDDVAVDEILDAEFAPATSVISADPLPGSVAPAD